MGTLGTILIFIHLALATTFSIKILLGMPYIYPTRLRAFSAMGHKPSQNLIAGPKAVRVFSAPLGWVIITILGLFGAYAVALKGGGYKRFFFAYTRKEMDAFVETLTPR